MRIEDMEYDPRTLGLDPRDAEIAAIKRQLAEALADGTSMGVQMVEDARTNATLRARVETLEAAHRAIASYPAERFDVIASDMRHIARAALSGKE